jgi:zinc protease
VSLRIWLRGGATAESTPGLAALSGRMLAEGTRERDWLQIALTCEERGMGLNATGGLETTGLAVDCLEEDLDLAVDLSAELLRHSTFPEDRFEWQREQAVAELQSAQDQPEVRASWAFFDQLYHPHALARPLLGSAESLARIERSDCESFHQESRQRGGWIAVAGAVDPTRCEARLREVFGPLRRLTGAVQGGSETTSGEPAGVGDRPPGRAERVREVELPGSQQMHLFAGHLTVARTHEDAAALEVLGVVLGAGNGLNGRYPHRLREREGFGYVAHAHAIAGAGRVPGRFVVYLGTSPENRGAAQDAIVEELARLLEDGITVQEFEDARNYLLGREAMRRETVAQRADLLSEAIFFGQPWNELEWAVKRYADLDRESVHTAMRQWLSVDELRWTVGLPSATEST